MQPDHALARATELLAADSAADALKLLEPLREQFQHSSAYWSLIAWCHYKRGATDAAISALETGTTLAPLGIPTQMLLGRLYSESGFRESATVIFDHLATLPRALRAHRPALIREFGKLRLYERSLDLCEQEIRALPDSWQAWYAKAYYMGRCELPTEEIVPIIMHALSLNETHIGLRISLVKALDSLGLDEDARGAASRIPVDRLVCLRCGSCVLKLASIYRAAGDTCRWKACVKRYADLRREKTNDN